MLPVTIDPKALAVIERFTAAFERLVALLERIEEIEKEKRP